MTNAHGSALAGPGIMLLSAVIFGYFGFFATFNHYGTNGQLLVYVPMLEWTLRLSAVLFAICAVLSFVHPVAGNGLYCLVGLIGAASLLVVAALDLADPQHTVMSPVILLVFAAWNGFSSWTGLKTMLSARRSAHDKSPIA